MFDIAALVLAVFLLLQLQRVRALLSFVFGPLRARRIAQPRIPEAIADLHAQAAAELAALGFEGPDWFLIDSPDGGTLAQPAAVWRQPEQGDTLWLFAPPAPHFANRLLSVFIRRLADGRHCVSEAFDCYAQIGANEQVLAQTIGGADFAAQWLLHKDWCARQGTTDLAGTDDASVDWQASGLHEQRLTSLQQRGKVYRDSQGLLRPRPGFAWQMYTALWRQPKPPANTQPVPPARLAWLAQVALRQTQRPVPRRVQAGLFAFSVALFLLLGGWFWGLRFAAILFVVVAIHEFGHYLAMRLSGYRNVQMLALPLVGGVTIGHEATPDAARRAWMSLMGPLPGIVIGWALAIYVLMNGAIGGLAYEAALVFLFVNYLNVLPVPPLDGAHVVQELLPVGSARLSAVFIATASLVGAALAFWLGFTLLAVIALLQLPGVRNRWQLGGVLRALRNDPEMDRSRPAGARQRRVFEIFDRVAGPTPHAPVRLALGAEALRSLDVKPMRLLQRVLVGGTYLLLLAGPIAAAVVSLSVWRSGVTLEADAGAMVDRYERDSARLAAQAAAMDVRALLKELLAQQPEIAEEPVAGADEAAFAAVRERLGQPLPADLAAFYRAADGATALGLYPLARLQPASAAADLDLASFAYEGTIAFLRPGTTPDHVTLTPAQLGTFLLLGHDRDLATVALYDTAEPPLHAGLRYYWLDSEGEAQAQPDLPSWLRERWSGVQLMTERLRRFEAAQKSEEAALAAWTPLQLLDAIERPAWWIGLISPGMKWRGAADEAQIGAVATRFGAPLPEDVAEVYRQHDGMPVLQMLPLEQWQAVTALKPDIADALRARHAALRAGTASVDVDACVVIAGYHDDAQLRTASLLWCPRNVPEQRYLDLVHGREWRAFVDLLRFDVARTRAAQRDQAGP
ncbi:site-2 protease family protein [Tahibacter sp.]|uniref:site-2 protease family protein n=1 Tax=Tahibacter sp. TaxID=2056211 RepID=UPI0028C4B24E|nr:site-2 protease family protein [Tahibacter sp.]